MGAFLKPSTVQKRLIKVLQHRKRLDDEYKRQVKRLKDEIADIQGRCAHEKVKYYPDPAGGYDSYYRCLICDFESCMPINPDEERAKEILKKNSGPRGQ